MDVLIAEDDPTSRRLFTMMFAKWGYRPVVAADGNEAWQIFQQGKVRMVVTDWMMPGLDGIELTKRIRHSTMGQGTYVMLYTAKSDRESIIEGLDAGADDCLCKPYDGGCLRAKVDAAARIVGRLVATPDRP